MNRCNSCTKCNKKGQVWTADAMIGLMLFVVVLIIVVKVAFSMYPSQAHIVVYRDAVHLSDALLSQGYPVNWTATEVMLPGIAENNRINTTQLSNFKALDYYRAKTLMHTTSDFLFFIKNSTGIINTGQCVYGYNITTNANCEPMLDTIKYDNLAKIDRLVIYNSTVVVMTIYAWN
jgi:hypothetical protein